MVALQKAHRLHTRTNSLYADWYIRAQETSVDTANNRSYVSVAISIFCSSGYSFTTDSSGSGLTGTTDTSFGRRTYSDGETTLASGGFWVAHNDNGEAAAHIFYWGSTTFGNGCSGDFWLPLTTIARASQPSINTYPNNSPNITAGTACMIHMNKKANYTHKVSYWFGNRKGTIATGVVDNCTWTPPTYLLDQIPNAQTGAGTITVETYNGNTKIGDGSCGFTLFLPSDASPSAGELTITENNANVKSKGDDITVQQISNKTVKVTATPKYYASISSVTLNGANMTLNNGEYTVTVGNLNDGKFTVKVKDSRGLTASKAVEQKFYSYSRPQITGASLKRVSETEANGELKIDGRYSTTLNNTLKVEIMRNDASYYTVLEATLSDGNMSASKTYDDLYYTASWSVDIRLTDGFGETANTTVRLGVGQYAVAIGKYDVKVGRNAYVNNEVRAKNFKFAGASPCMHYVGNAWHLADKGVAIQMTSALSGHRFTSVDIYDPDYIEKAYDDGGYPSVRIKKKGRYLLPAKVQGSNVQGNSSYGFGFTINKTDNSGEFAYDQYEIRFTTYACAGTAMFVKDLNEGDIIRYQVFSDLTRKCEYLWIGFIYLTDQ
jgi:hypothetical protein